MITLVLFIWVTPTEPYPGLTAGHETWYKTCLVPRRLKMRLLEPRAPVEPSKNTSQWPGNVSHGPTSQGQGAGKEVAVALESARTCLGTRQVQNKLACAAGVQRGGKGERRARAISGHHHFEFVE